MTSYRNLGTGGADTWADSVATAAELPATGALNEVRLVSDTGAVMYWNGSAWASTAGGGGGATDIEDLTAFTNGSSAGAGLITQVITAAQPTANSSNVGATGVFGYAVSISVTAGRWVVTGVAGFEDNGALLSGAIEATITNTSTAGGVTADSVAKDDSITGGSALSRSFVVPEIVISISSTTTYYLNTKFTYSSGSPLHYGKITARRIG